MRLVSMQEDMYTYHYFRNRAIIKRTHTADYLLSTILLCSTAFFASTLFIMLK
jgi:hypothetical protein